ncbi:MAG: SpoIIE family protein phosphatase [Leptolyngbyaceae cyanobacterium RU_5_1]|nr:SpoIIE family protein phosphatase [Leptolyngbyaceae cyanobacterium RU_5_1]
MHSPEATIHCPNPMCQALNPESHRFCQQCRTALPKRYLWAVGKAADSVRPGQLLASRYWCKQSRVFMDTKPGLLPDSPEELPETVEPYLRLFPYQLHVPQIYAVVPSPKKRAANILLLDRAPIYPYEVSDSDGNGQESTLMPALETIWPQSTALRQLNWLWQMAQLWEPLMQEGVASSLLTPNSLRVEDSLVRLLELQSNSEKTPVLADLGKIWQRWQPSAQPEIADYLKAVCRQLQQGEVDTVEQLLWMLDQAIAVCGQAQTRQLQIATLTDQGPMRQRNEDACYPASGTTMIARTDWGERPSSSNGTLPLVVVCDGIGGHEGGNVASNLAIATVQQRLQKLIYQANQLAAATLTAELEHAALVANDVITERNDAEQRHERQRMGTTLVMALGQDHELYLTHVGDSRAYRVTRTGCHQVTVDDDLASREVRLGYALYRNALQQPNSGSLVQALGMNVSSLLHPTVQRFILDEDCLFLLCSDGLSDNDRVEEHWQTILLPVLEGKMDLGTASRQLIEIANEQNGHDNVTVGLVCCRVLPHPQSPSSAQLSASLATLPASPTTQQPAFLPVLKVRPYRS